MDPSFGGDGTVTTESAPSPAPATCWCRPMARIVAVGAAERRPSGRGALPARRRARPLLRRRGRVGRTLEIGSWYELPSRRTQSRSSRTGSSCSSAPSDAAARRDNTQLAVVRLNADGSLDRSFHRDGTLSPGFGGSCTYGEAVALAARRQDPRRVATTAAATRTAGRSGSSASTPTARPIARSGAAGGSASSSPAGRPGSTTSSSTSRGGRWSLAAAGREFGKGRYRVTHALARLTPAGRSTAASAAAAPRWHRAAGPLTPGSARARGSPTAGSRRRDDGLYSRRRDPRIAVFGPDGGLDRTFRRGGAGPRALRRAPGDGGRRRRRRRRPARRRRLLPGGLRDHPLGL